MICSSSRVGSPSVSGAVAGGRGRWKRINATAATMVPVANSTRADGRSLLSLAAEIPVRTEIESFQLPEANRALQNLKDSHIHGAGVLVI